MKALTVRNIPSDVAEVIRRRAEGSRTSFSKALIALLEEQIQGRGRRKRSRDLSYVAGSWSEDEYRTFHQGLAEQRKIDPELWK